MSFRKLLKTWWNALWSTRWYLLLFIILNFLFSFVNIAIGIYIDKVPSAVVSDIILDNTPALNLDIIYIWVFLFMTHFLYIYPIVFEPRRAYYYFGLIFLLYVTRTLFIALTHLQGDPSCLVPSYPAFFQALTFKNDLFFSGHTAFPFLGFLMFRNRYAKAFFLTASLVLAATVLLTHCHYSIDVFAAFFIAYGVYVGGTKLFTHFGWMPEQLRTK
ncbi:MAG: phosphatase PAP2-related protein [Nanoarchaeota archaeon]